MHSVTRHFGNSTRLVQDKQFLQNKFQITTLKELEDNEAPRRCYLVGCYLVGCYLVGKFYVIFERTSKKVIKTKFPGWGILLPR